MPTRADDRPTIYLTEADFVLLFHRGERVTRCYNPQCRKPFVQRHAQQLYCCRQCRNATGKRNFRQRHNAAQRAHAAKLAEHTTDEREQLLAEYRSKFDVA